VKKLTREILYAGLLILGVDLVIWWIVGGSFVTATLALFGMICLVFALVLRIIRWMAR